MNNPSHHNPPKWPVSLLKFFLKKEYVEEIEGDMEEIFQDNIETHSLTIARRKYIFQMLLLLRPSLVKKAFGLRRINNLWMATHYVKIGWRSIRKEKVSSIINISGLTIGLSACLIIAVFVKYESTFDHQHTLADKIFRVVQHTQYPQEELHWNTTAYPLAVALREDFEFDLVTQTAGPFQRMFSITDKLDNIKLFEEEFVLFADKYYPLVFDLNWLAGDKNTALNQIGSVVLTEQIAVKNFGSVEAALGQILMLNAKDQLIVTGVISNAVGNSNLRYGMIIPYQFFKFHNNYPANNWSGNYGGTTFVVLNDPAQESNTESVINNWKGKYLDDQDNQRISYFLQPLKEIHNETLYGASPSGYIMPKKVLNAALFIGAFILLIAIVNFVNLITAKAGTRSKEVGIRKAIGSSRFSLIKQFLFENIMLVFITIFFSVIVSNLALGYLNKILTQVNLQLELTWMEAGIVFATGLTTILLATIYPALVLSSFKPIRALRNEVTVGGAKLRKLLTTLQFALVQIFVIGTFIASQQMNYFQSKELGFSSEAVITTPIPNGAKLEYFKTSLLANNLFSNVSIGSGPPMAVDGFQLGTTFRLPHQEEVEGFSAEMKIGDVDYLDFYDIPIIAGRNFSGNKRRFDEFIVNEKVLERLNWTPAEAIGKKLRINEGEATIIGVMKDFHNNSLQSEVSPTIIMNWEHFLSNMFIKTSGNNTAALIELEELWKATFPKAIFSYSFIEDSMEREYAMEKLVFKGFSLFSILVILIGSLGLFGLMSFITLKKTKEVGIRKVLGASVGQITLFFSREFTILISVAFLLAAPAAYFLMERWLQDFVYRIEPGVGLFLAGGLFTLFVAGLASIFQILRTATLNPVETLRSE